MCLPTRSPTHSQVCQRIRERIRKRICEFPNVFANSECVCQCVCEFANALVNSIPFFILKTLSSAMGCSQFREMYLCPPCSSGEALPFRKTSLWLPLSSCFHFLLCPAPAVLKMGASASQLTTAWSTRVGSLPLSSGPASFFCFVFLFFLLSAQNATALPRT